MSEASFQERIIALICSEVLVGVEVNEIHNETRLIEDLHLDSIQMIGLITGLENEFGIVLDDEDLDLAYFTTINSLAEFVQSKMAA